MAISTTPRLEVGERIALRSPSARSARIPELAARALVLESGLALLAAASAGGLVARLAALARALGADGAAVLVLDAATGTLVWREGAPPDARPVVLRELPELAARLARLEPAWLAGTETGHPWHSAGLGACWVQPVCEPSIPACVLLVHGLEAPPDHGAEALIRLVADEVATRARADLQATALAAAEERFELSQTGSTAALFEWDVVGQRIWWSPQLRALLGYASGADPAHHVLWRDLVHPDDLARVERELSAHLDGLTPRFDLIYRCLREDGSSFWAWGRLTARRDAGGRLTRIVGTVLDISEQVRVERAWKQAEARAEVTLGAMADAILTTDAAGHVDYLNPAAERLCGVTRALARGVPVEQVVRLVGRGVGGDELVRRCLADGEACQRTDLLHLSADGRSVSLSVTVAPIHAGGERQGCVLVLRDETERHELERQLAYQASHDALTGLVNRREFERRLACAQTDVATALMYLDLDHFKVVNDTCGHAAGDALLRELGTLFRAVAPEQASVARLGGDEFGVLAPRAGAEMLAESLRTRIAALRFHWEGQVFRIGVSVGMVPVAPGVSVAELLAAADTACFAAKDAGGDRVHLGGPGDLVTRRHRGELAWVARLQAALDADRFELWRQEIRALDGGPSHHELLLRLVDERGRLVPPDVFVPAAERHGLMGRLDRWVVERALAWLAARPSAGVHAINLSGQTLADPGALTWLRAAFDRHGVAPSRVCFEVTETAAIARLDPALELMRALRSAGCRFALDDFGAGMASFAYLRQLPIDLLKIDGRFVRRVTADTVDRELVRMANGLGHLLGLRTVAEYAEDGAVIQVLRELGVDYAQGYGIGRPEPLPEGV